MAITTADGWFAAAKQQIRYAKTASVTTVAATPFSMLDVAGYPGAGSLTLGNTTSGILETDSTAGYPTINNFGGGAIGYLASAAFRNSVAGGLILYDRIFDVGSVSLTALATTTLSAQPSISGRVPNGTDFTDTEILLEINAAVSATATTVAVGYTNEAGTTGRTTGATSSLSGFTNKRIIQMPLQAGDKGVQKIESVTVGGTVATAGSVNAMIVRRLAQFDVRVANGQDIQGWDVLGAPQVFDTSALFPVIIPDSTSSGLPSLLLTILNG